MKPGQIHLKIYIYDFPVLGRTNWPLLFDMNHKPKQVVKNIMDF